jgi:hypothetical protein
MRATVPVPLGVPQIPTSIDLISNPALREEMPATNRPGHDITSTLMWKLNTTLTNIFPHWIGRKLHLRICYEYSKFLPRTKISAISGLCRGVSDLRSSVKLHSLDRLLAEVSGQPMGPICSLTLEDETDTLSRTVDNYRYELRNVR